MLKKIIYYKNNISCIFGLMGDDVGDGKTFEGQSTLLTKDAEILLKVRSEQYLVLYAF